ncbi:Hypothetical protein FKW44_019727 [Caligus rogercresseyi]|uniref:Uncharacterized protein n=1 Tax=Caligus rogercresseyi TaxID=217165 RepID=A0A7T8GX03_CALRO|nr:Hypothetical protein FKW44_019727 [Caligus rogercresseyi]
MAYFFKGKKLSVPSLLLLQDGARLHHECPPVPEWFLDEGQIVTIRTRIPIASRMLRGP